LHLLKIRVREIVSQANSDEALKQAIKFKPFQAELAGKNIHTGWIEPQEDSAQLEMH
jgi:hypothetical protein